MRDLAPRVTCLAFALVSLLCACASTTAPKGPAVDASIVFAPKGGGDGVGGRVRCEATPGGGVACSISHEGDRPLTVCFHAELTCQNGERASAESCRETGPGVEIRTLHAVEGCDRAVSGRVTAAWIVEK
ncbi:MAG: hypothetical protein HYV09_25310 [Deltaproteobacteria bacterium]|nr:hypothetical protein [Deltaproteobacteria bacterium]